MEDRPFYFNTIVEHLSMELSKVIDYIEKLEAENAALKAKVEVLAPIYEAVKKTELVNAEDWDVAVFEMKLAYKRARQSLGV